MIAIVRHSLRGHALATLILCLTLASPVAVGQQRVGVNSAVNPEATGIPPGASPRRLVLGQEIVLNERIATGAGGQTQILFVDGSSMTVGPNSFMVIDQFRYDPNSGSGSLVTSLSRGLFRFIGGKLSKQDNAVTMHTPSATIEIRGGVILVDLSPEGKLDTIFAYGKGAVVTGLNGISQTITRPGFQITVPGRGAAPSAPSPAPPGASAAILAQLDGRPGGTGGATAIPTDSNVASSGVLTTTSTNVPAATQAQTQQQAQLQTQQPAQVEAPVQQAQTTLQLTANQPSTPNNKGSVPIVTYAGLFKSTNGSGSALGFVNQSANARIAYTDGIFNNGFLTSALAGAGRLTIPLAPGSARFGPAGTFSPLGPVSGTSFMSADGTFFYANLTPVNSPNQREFVFGGVPVNQSFYAPTRNVRLFAFAVQQDAALQSPIPFVTNSTGGNIPSPSVSPFYVVAPANSALGAFNPNIDSNVVPTRFLQASLAINGQSANQSSALVVNTGGFLTSSDTGSVIGSGFVRSSFLPNGTSLPVRIASSSATVPDGFNNNLFGGNAISGFAIDQNGYNANLNFQQQLASQFPYGCTTVNYAFNHPVAVTALPVNIGASRTSQMLFGSVGGIIYPQTAANGFGQPYVSYGDASVATGTNQNHVSATLDGFDIFAAGNQPRLTLYFGGQSPNRSAFIDDSNFTAIESSNQSSMLNGTTNGSLTGAIVTSNLVSSNTLLPNGLCQQCQFLQWGYWTGQLDIPNATGTAVVRTDRAHINTWVAGIPTVTLPPGGVGTFTGNALGTVYNNGASYLAAGGFTNTYNFGSQTGTVAISNFDSRTFAGTVQGITSVAANGQVIHSYMGALSGSGLSGRANGTFFGPGAPETGGSFAVQSPTYLASGIFAGKR
jgi:hypothetical protein